MSLPTHGPCRHCGKDTSNVGVSYHCGPPSYRVFECSWAERYACVRRERNVRAGVIT